MLELPWTIPGGQQVYLTPFTISGKGGGDAVVTGNGSIRSEDYVAGSAGWRIDGAGNVEFSSGTFRGVLDAATGTFAGDLSAVGGTFTGSLTAASGTFTGSLTAATGTFNGDISGANGIFTGSLSASNIIAGTISASTFNMDGSNVNSGTLGTVNGTNVTNLHATNITTGTLSANFISGGSVTANILSGGAISGVSIDIGGTDATSFHVDTTGRIWLGAGTWAGAATKFRVSAGGVLEASGAIISGAITATSGTFTGTVSASSFTGTNSMPDATSHGLQSGDYSAGVAGWKIRGDGDVEFNNGTFRGSVTGGTIVGGTFKTSTSGARVEISSDEVRFYNATALVGTLDGLGASAFTRLTGSFVVTGTLEANSTIHSLTYMRAGNFRSKETLDALTSPGHAWDTDTNTGMYNIANGQIGFASNGVKVLELNIANESRIFFAASQVRTMKWQSDGNIVAYNNTTSYWSSGTSDRRLKKNITTADSASAIGLLNQFDVVTFEWRDATGYAEDPLDRYFHGQKHWGLVGQDVELVYPQAVDLVDATDRETDPKLKRKNPAMSPADLHMVKLERMVPLLISAAQDHNSRIEALEAQVALLLSP